MLEAPIQEADPAAATFFQPDATPVNRTAALFVWLVWAFMIVGALLFSWRYGFSAPYFDEWGFVDAMCGEGITFSWLWSAYGDHRLPLAKPIWLAWLALTNSFRAGALADVLILGGCAAGLILAARRVRGRTEFTDAFFPLAALHWGQGLNFLWSYQISEMLPAFLQFAILMIVICRGSSLSDRWLILLGLCLMALGLGGPGGLPFALAMALWFFGWGVSERHRRLSAYAAIAFAVATLGVIALYFVGFKGQEREIKPTPDVIARGSIEFLSTSLGPATAPVWLWAGWAVLVFLLASLVLSAATFIARPNERTRASAFVFMIGAGLILALAMGFSRGPYGPGGALSHWYIIFGLPALTAAYFSWIVFGPPTLGPLVQMVLMAAVCAALPFNLQAGRREAIARGRVVRDFEEDLHSGMIPILLAERYAAPISDAPDYLPEHFEAHLRKLHAAGVGPFRFLSGPFIDSEREISVPLTPSAVNEASWKILPGSSPDDKPYLALDLVGTDPFVIFRLAEPRHVYAVRLALEFEHAGPPAESQLFWANRRKNEFFAPERVRTWKQRTTPGIQYVNVVINAEVDEIRFDPDTKRGRVKVRELSLLR